MTHVPPLIDTGLLAENSVRYYICFRSSSCNSLEEHRPVIVASTVTVGSLLLLARSNNS